MARRRLVLTAVSTLASLALALAGVSPALAGRAAKRSSAGPAAAGHCSAGAHTLSGYGAVMYPETGNGGYTSVHTDIDMVYDAASNTFLPGNHVVLTDRATQCLSSFSLDFERTSADPSGPDMSVTSVRVDGRPARFAFAQPTYPGDPHGPNDPDPLAHEASQANPVGGPGSNTLPPACSPELSGSDTADALDGTQCPANKLVITPTAPIRAGAAFTVSVSYTGRPGVHDDGDGSTEGWFAAPDGGFVTTEPVGSEDWMPLDDYPTAKPTYDFYDTVNAGKTAIANGQLIWTRDNRPDQEFPAGSVTYHWHQGAPIASYLVEDSVGDYTLTSRTASDGLTFYEAQDQSISAAQQATNLAIMNQQQDITDFESQFNGPFPFSSDGVIVGTPPASFEEEMETMITFAGGRIGLSTLYHENMHQWWGDNVTEGGYDMTFYKEGMAQLAQYMFTARTAETAAGGPGTAAGQAAFTASLIGQFNSLYARGASFWSDAPSHPSPFTLFDTAPTYQRPAAAYIALWQILGTARFTAVLQQIQRHYGGGSITEPQLEAAFQRGLPDQGASCRADLDEFFTQWFDTAYPTASGATEPAITGPGLTGAGFFTSAAGCPAS
ncbi:MAG TPA: M1 family aminopeptidase [Streptosporangiaceae bacterium]